VLKLNIPHVLVNYLHTDLDYFYLKNHHTLSNFWGYKQIHYWSSPCVLLSGTPGDEFTVRSPTTANMMLKHHSESIDDLLDSFKESLHYRYFLRYTDLFRSQQSLSFITLTSAINECLNIILNDYQHWHLGETLCYTPLRDVEIFSTIASLHKQDLIKQIFNSRVQKELIMRNAPHLLDSLSTDKNTDNYMSNLTNLYTRPPQGSNL
jgi:glutamine synthetase adenylyltransferase